jgi:hypothetical protein
MTETSSGQPDPYCPPSWTQSCAYGDIYALEDMENRWGSWVHNDGWTTSDLNRLTTRDIPDLASDHFYPWPWD